MSLHCQRCTLHNTNQSPGTYSKPTSMSSRSPPWTLFLVRLEAAPARITVLLISRILPSSHGPLRPGKTEWLGKWSISDGRGHQSNRWRVRLMVKEYDTMVRRPLAAQSKVVKQTLQMGGEWKMLVYRKQDDRQYRPVMKYEFFVTVCSR